LVFFIRMVPFNNATASILYCLVSPDNKNYLAELLQKIVFRNIPRNYIRFPKGLSIMQICLCINKQLIRKQANFGLTRVWYAKIRTRTGACLAILQIRKSTESWVERTAFFTRNIYFNSSNSVTNFVSYLWYFRAHR
jgi:hypothetical protein